MARMLVACSLLALVLAVSGCPSNSADPQDDVAESDVQDPGGDTSSGGDTAPHDVAAPDVEGDVAADVADDAGEDVFEGKDVADDVEAPEELVCAVVTGSGERPTGEGEIALSMADEAAAYVGTPGFQVDLRATLPKAVEGSRAKLSVAGVRVAEKALVVDPATGRGEVVFEGVAIPHAPGGVTASITITEAGEAVDACTGTIVIDLGACPVELEPAPAGECLSEDEDGAPGFQRRFTVRSSGGGCDRASLVFQAGADPLQTSTVELDETGAASFLLTLFPNTVSLNNESVSVTAVVTDSTNPGREGRSAAQIYDIDTEPPVVTIAVPAGPTVTTSQDEDGNPANGIQVSVRGTVRGVTPADGAALKLSVDGANISETVVDATGAFAFPAITMAEERAYTIAISADDSCGAHGETSVTVDAETIAPTVTCAVVTRGGERPTGGGAVSLELADEPEAYVDEPGFQVDVRAGTSRVAAGATAALVIDGATVAEETVTVADGMQLGEVVFTDVTVPHAPEGVAFAVVVSDGDTERARCVGTVALDMGPCPVEVRPVAGACLRTDEDPAAGFQRRFTVRSVGGWCDEAALVFESSGEPVLTPTQPLDENGEASFVVTLFSTTVALNNEAVLVVGVAGDSAAADREAESAPRVYTVDTQPPAVTITEPSDPIITLADDEDGVAGNGLQLVVQGVAAGVVPGDGAAVQLVIDGEAVAETVASPSGAFAFPAYTFVESGTYSLTVTAGDTCGGHGEATKVIRVETVVPELAIVAPADGTTLWARGDGDRATPLAYEMIATVRAEDVYQGTTLSFRCAQDQPGSPLMTVAEYDVVEIAPDARYAVPVAFRVDLLGTTQVCSVSTDGRNPGQSGQVHLVVALPAPQIALGGPADGTLTNADAADVSGAAVNLDGQPLVVRLEDEEGLVVAEMTVEDAIDGGAFAQSFPFEMGGEPVADGHYQLVVDATDVLGNVASDQPESLSGVWLTLDRTAPSLTIDWPSVDGLNPGTDPDAVDSDPETPGYQTNVVIAVGGEAAAGDAEVCLEKDGVDLGCVAPMVANGEGVDGGEGRATATFANVTFQPGANALAVVGHDAAGNEADAVALDVNLALDAPRVTISAPVAGLITLDAVVDVVVDVTDEGGIGPVLGAEVALLVGGQPTAVVVEELGGGQYRFPSVPLASGPNQLRATALAGGTDGVSDPITVTYKTAAPALSFVTPVDGAVLNRTSDDCEPGSTDCTLAVSVTASDFETSSPVALTIDCNGVMATYDSAAAGDKAIWSDITLPHGHDCTLSVTGTDAVGQVASAGPITVTIDRVAPAVTDIDLPEVLQWTADLQPATPGMQIALTVTLDGVEAGQIVTVVATNDGGETLTSEIPLPAEVAEGAPTPVEVGLVTLPEDFVEVSVSVSDAAGNPALTARRSLYVNSEEPVVELVLPEYVPNDPCTTNADCAVGGACSPSGCARGWGASAAFEVQVGLTGIAHGTGALRICSDHADLAGGTACAAAGYYQVARVDVTADDQTVSLEGALPEGFQELVAEAETLPGNGEWVSSTDNPAAFLRIRPVVVDTTPPRLLDLTAASDAGEPFGTLNIAERVEPGTPGGGGVYTLRVEASEPSDVTFFVNGAEVATIPVAAGFGDAVVALDEGANTVQARITDRVGNVSDLLPAEPYAPVVDTVPPTLTFVYPDHTPVIAGESLNVSLRSDAVGQEVTLFDGGATVGGAPVAPNGIVLFVHAGYAALADGEHALTAEVRDVANNPTSAVSAPAVVTVDTEPPTIAVAAPAMGAMFADADDAAPGVGGFQVNVRFTPTGAQTWRAYVASGCDASHANCGAPVEHGAGSADGSEVAFTLTVPVSGATTYHLLGIEARDEHGNVGVELVPFTVDLVECVVSLAGLAPGGVYNNALCPGTPGANCTSVAGGLTVSYALSCAGVDEVALFKGGARWVGTTALDNQEGTLDVLFNHGDTFDLSARVLSGGAVVGDSGATPVRVDLRDPVPSFAAATVDGFVTAASGDVVLYSSLHDQDPATPSDVEIHVRLTATDDGELVGGAVSAIVRQTGAVTVPLAPTNAALPKDIAAAPFSGDFKNLRLPIGLHQVVATVRDKAGNTATTSFTAEIDAVAPIVHDTGLPSVLLASADVRPGDAGMQVGLVMTVEGVEAGQEVSIRAENGSGDVRNYAIPTPIAAPDGVMTAVDLGIVTLPEGDVTLTVDVSDVAGNAAETTVQPIYVTSLPPVVRMTQPNHVPNDPCTTSAQCASGGVCSPQGCATSWGSAAARSVRVTVEGVAPGADGVRVCSDHPSLSGGDACATVGFYELARASYSGAPIDVPLAAVLPEGFQILVAEAETIAGNGAWIPSTDAASATYRRRFVYVDTDVPAVTSVTLPGDVEVPTGVLNIAEQAEAGRRYLVRVAADEAGTATIRVNGAVATTAPVSGGAAQATVTLVEGANTIEASVADLVGNGSGLAAPVAVTVDTVLPTLTFVYPEHTPVLSGQDVAARLQSDAIGRTINLYDGAPPVLVASATVAPNGTAVFAGALTDGTHTFSADVTDAAGNPKGAVTSPATVEVDTTPPVVLVSAPGSGATFVDADDADPATGGFQTTARFTPTGADTWTLSLSSGCDASFTNCGAPVELDAGAAADVEVSRVITVPVASATSYFVLTVDARDALGNTTSTSAPFTVQLSNCVVTLEGLPAGGTYANAMCAGTAGEDCDSVSDTLTVRYTLACVGADAVALYKGGVQFASTGSIVNQEASFDVTFAHGEAFDLSARVLSGAATVGDSGVTPVKVDLHDPTPLFVAASVAGFTTAASGDSVAWGIADDQQPASAGSAEVPVRLTATDDGTLVGGQVVSVERITGGVPVALSPTNVTLPYAIAAAPLQVDLLNLSLPVGGPHTIRATVRDKAGNLATTEFVATVDLTAPVIASVDLPAHLDWTDDLDPGEAGMQVEVLVTLSGVEAGQDVDIVAAVGGGDVFSYAVAVPSDVADGVPTQVSLGTLTLPEGDATVTADVSDVAGNPASQASASLYVDSDEPDVRMLLPTRVPNVACTTSAQCANGGVCTPSGCAAPWSAASTLGVSVGLIGVAPGAQNLRICSNHPSLSGNAPCAIAGYYTVATVDVSGGVEDVSLDGAIPQGFQILSAEAEPWAGDGGWVSSLDGTNDLYQRRAVYVDTVLPTVSALTSPSDTLAPTGVLNIAEQFDVGRKYRMRVQASEDGTARFHVNGVQVATATVTAGVAEATVTLQEGANSVQASVSDLVGNASALSPATPYAPSVDTIAPTLTFTAPAASPVLAGDSLDVRLTTNAAAGRTVTLSDGGVEVGTAPVSGGAAVFPHATFGALSEGDHTLTAVVTDAAGNPANAATSPALVQVDTVAPGLVVAAPTSGALFADADDADPVAGGFQVTVRFTPSGADTWALDLAAGCDASHANCGAPTAQGSGAAAGVEVTRTITVPVASAMSYFRVGVEAEDTLGNLTRTEVPFTVQLTNCVVSVTGVPGGGIYNNALCASNPGQDCASVDDTLTVQYTTACVGTDELALYKDGVPFATTTTITDQTATFDVTFTHGEQFDLSARALTGGSTVGDSGTSPVKVDLHDPVPQFVVATVDGFETAPSGASVLYGIADDQQPASASSVEIHLQLSATDDFALTGGRIASLYRDSTALTPSNLAIPYSIGAESLSVPLKNLTLPDGGPYTIRVTVTDGANNNISTALTVTADTTRPGAVALQSIPAADVNPRRPSITVRWAAVADDGAAGDPAASYEVRYAYAPIASDAAFDAACDVRDLVPGLALPTPGAPGAAEEYTVDGPDARSPADPCRLVTTMDTRPIYVAVKAVDAAGNRSLLGVDSAKSTSDVKLRSATIAGDGTNIPAGVSWYTWAPGDLDGDGLGDMVLSDLSSGTVCVVYGHADDAEFTVNDYLLDGAERVNHVCTAGFGYGYGFGVASNVDLNGDGIHDLVHGGGFLNNGVVRVHFGVPGGHVSPTANLTISGMRASTFSSLWVSSAGDFDGDAVGDIAFEAGTEVGPEGRQTGAVYVLPGNATWSAATSLAINVTNGTDRATHRIARIAVQGTEDTGTPPNFGWRVAGVGNLLADGGGSEYDDLAIVQRLNDNTIYVVKGRPLVGAVDILVTDLFSLADPPTGEDAQVLRLVPEFGVTQTNWGKSVVAEDLDGDGLAELLVGHPKGADDVGAYSLYVFRGADIAAELGQLYTRISVFDPVETEGDMKLGLRGFILSGDYQAPTVLGDFDDEGGLSPDIALRMKSDTQWGEIYVRLGLPDYVTDAFAPFEDLVIDHPNGTGPLGFGSWTAGVGDVNGDGFPDILVGGDPAQGAPAAVLIY